MPAKSTAQTLLDKADKKANSSAGWFSSASTKFEDAGDLYQQAANSFKIGKLYKEAGDAFSREAECREKCKETNDAANAWWNAAKAYKKTHPDREACLACSSTLPLISLTVAVQALTQTITHLCQSGRFRQAADREKEIGQIYLQEFHDLGKACDSFVRAGDWYAQEDAAAQVSFAKTFYELYSFVNTEQLMLATKMRLICWPNWISSHKQLLVMNKWLITR